MTYEAINNIISNLKPGTIHTITYTSQLKTRKGVTDVITKTTTTQVMLKTKYDNIAAVKAARISGELPEVNQGLPKGTVWLDNRKVFIKAEASGKIQLRCQRAHGNPSKTVYRKNGIVVDKAEVEPLCLKSEFPDYSKSTPIPVFNVTIDKIDRLK